MNKTKITDKEEYEDLKNNVASMFYYIETGRIVEIPMFGVNIKCRELDIWVSCYN